MGYIKSNDEVAYILASRLMKYKLEKMNYTSTRDFYDAIKFARYPGNNNMLIELLRIEPSLYRTHAGIKHAVDEALKNNYFSQKAKGKHLLALRQFAIEETSFGFEKYSNIIKQANQDKNGYFSKKVENFSAPKMLKDAYFSYENESQAANLSLYGQNEKFVADANAYLLNQEFGFYASDEYKRIQSEMNKSDWDKPECRYLQLRCLAVRGNEEEAIKGFEELGKEPLGGSAQKIIYYNELMINDIKSY